MTAVAYLVRKANGPEPVRTFIESYRRYRAGAEHELVFLLKGFGSEKEARPILSIADGLVGRTVLLPDSGYDIGAYRTAAETLDFEVFCFLNSFSEICADDWLAKLKEGHASDMDLVGASGSFGSHLSGVLMELGLGKYRRLFTSTPGYERSLRIRRARVGDQRSQLRRSLGALWGLPAFAIAFPCFASHHVRTNVFLISRVLFRAVRCGDIRTKLDAWKFENGRRSLTRQAAAMGGRVSVVGADGHVFEPDKWPDSNTFWQSHQENLLVADNQTRDYATGDLDHRVYLSVFAWGERANPAPPSPIALAASVGPVD